MSSSRRLIRINSSFRAGLRESWDFVPAFWKAYNGAAPGEVARHDLSDLSPVAGVQGRFSWLDCLLTLRLNLGLMMAI